MWLKTSFPVFSNWVSKFKFSYNIYSAISVFVPLSGPFYNLIELELHSTSSYGWKHLPFLLNNAPKLEVLVFTEMFTDHKGCYEVFASQETEHLPEPVALNF